MMPLNKQAMTLVEVLITVSLIALLSAFLLPAVSHAIQQRENALTASRLRIAVNAFELYQSETGAYPEDGYPGTIPSVMSLYFQDLKVDEWWSDTTPVGGRWDWDKGYHFAYSVSVNRATAKKGQLEKLDSLLDDGDLTTGSLRLVDRQLHYIIKE